MKTSKEPTLQARDRLLEAAENLLWREGMASLKARRLTKEANINVSMISYYFGGIDGLVTEIFNLNFEKLRNLQTQTLAEFEKSGEVTIKAIMEATIRPILNPAVYCVDGRSSIVVHEIYAHASPNVKQTIDEKLLTGFEPMVDLFAKYFPQFSKETIAFRLCCISGAAMSMTPRHSNWDLYENYVGKKGMGSDSLLNQLIDFGIASFSK